MKNSDFYSHQQTHILALSIKQQNTQMQLMLDILLEEHRTLSSTDVDQFERVVSKKQELVNQIESTQIQLTEIHKILGGRLSKERLAAYINSMPANKNRQNLQQLWNNFQDTLKKCSEQNIINHRIMDASSIHLREAIGILRGDNSGPATDVYGSSGKQHTTLDGQSLAFV
ncbi:MAG: flagellar protein FlgN [Ectothiorhodospiraceae bacterium]|nr:flagellar protein FlgN [Ectothiorhodospiraceae bacterium]